MWLGFSLGMKVVSGPIDFQAIYYGARCLLENHNPYSVTELDRVYRAENGESPPVTPLDRKSAAERRETVTLYVNLPILFLFIAPIAMLHLGAAQWLWLFLTGGGMVLAAFLIWDIGAKYSRGVSLFLVCILLANSELAFATGNTGGIVADLCVVGAWCFLAERFALVGILCMAASLAIKPHDVGLVWLFFLLAGGVYRKRALQTLGVTALLALSAILWVSSVAPHWIQGWQSNMAAISGAGGLNDPGPASVGAHTLGRVISLQAIISVFRDEAHIYNLGTYLVCGALLLVWSITTLRSRSSPERAWLALAAIVPLTILVTYHRIYDAKLLLLVVPASAMLWAAGGPVRWLSLLVSTAGIVLNADLPVVFLVKLFNSLHVSTASLSGQLLTVLLDRPTPLILLAMSIFYLWVYVRTTIPDRSRDRA
jgi:hypothetical protein